MRIERTVEFEDWLDGLRDARAQAKIAGRILRIEAGLLGDWKTPGLGKSRA